MSADASKKLATVGAKHLSAPERSFWVLSDNIKLPSWDIEGKNIKKLLGPQKIIKLFIYKGWHLSKGSSESHNP